MTPTAPAPDRPFAVLEFALAEATSSPSDSSTGKGRGSRSASGILGKRGTRTSRLSFLGPARAAWSLRWITGEAVNDGMASGGEAPPGTPCPGAQSTKKQTSLVGAEQARAQVQRKVVKTCQPSTCSTSARDRVSNWYFVPGRHPPVHHLRAPSRWETSAALPAIADIRTAAARERLDHASAAARDAVVMLKHPA